MTQRYSAPTERVEWDRVSRDPQYASTVLTENIVLYQLYVPLKISCGSAFIYCIGYHTVLFHCVSAMEFSSFKKILPANKDLHSQSRLIVANVYRFVKHKIENIGKLSVPQAICVPVNSIKSILRKEKTTRS